MAVLQQCEDVAQSRDICGLCSIQFSKYKCPKCDINYCSLNCYKSQSHADCSEVFYKDCFMEELSQRKGSAEEKKKMIEILERVRQDDNNDDSQVYETPLEERISEIDLDSDPDQVWLTLTEKEKRQFHQMYETGTLAELLVTTPPWWEVMPKIQEIDEATPTDGIMPIIPSNIPALSSLVKVISPCVANNVVNVLYSYIYTWRIFHSSINDLPVQVVQTILELSPVLSDNISFATVQEAILHTIASVHSNPLIFNSSHYSLSLVKDVVCLIKRGSFVSHTLAHIYHIVTKAKRTLKQSADD